MYRLKALSYGPCKKGNLFLFFKTVIIEDVSPAQEAEVVYKANDGFNNFDEAHLLKDFKKFQRKKAEAILSEMKKQPDQLTFDSTGVVIIEGKSVPESNIKDFLTCLFTGKPSNPIGFDDFIDKLQRIGLSRFIPRKRLPHKTFQIKNDDRGGPFSLEKWYFIGQ